MNALKYIVFFLIEGYLAFQIVTTLLNIASQSIGKTILTVGLYAVGMVGIYFFLWAFLVRRSSSSNFLVIL